MVLVSYVNAGSITKLQLNYVQECSAAEIFIATSGRSLKVQMYCSYNLQNNVLGLLAYFEQCSCTRIYQRMCN